ncbi:hypothetical protein IEQ34_015254 [Dendrobium chrysotoxum]|uniref:Uncharacterized protein n=1 Tax=Dendrobium chrysotoxum TaxID=161865 RepID=A0AAV7GIA7_DENCH|nr:hypothetical protein IEQ34_015254 [Dendrobium chrysotoxum]
MHLIQEILRSLYMSLVPQGMDKYTMLEDCNEEILQTHDEMIHGTHRTSSREVFGITLFILGYNESVRATS